MRRICLGVDPGESTGLGLIVYENTNIVYMKTVSLQHHLHPNSSGLVAQSTDILQVRGFLGGFAVNIIVLEAPPAHPINLSCAWSWGFWVAYLHEHYAWHSKVAPRIINIAATEKREAYADPMFDSSLGSIKRCCRIKITPHEEDALALAHRGKFHLAKFEEGGSF